MKIGFALNAVAIAIGGNQIAECVPRTDITPANRTRDNRCVRGFFHQSVVDRNAFGFCKGICIEFDLVLATTFNTTRDGKAFFNGVEHLRRKALELSHRGLGRHAEHAGVPEVFTAIDIRLCGLEVWLLNKALDGVAFGFDIAVACFWRLRFDTEGRDFASLCQFDSGLHGVGKCLQVTD